MPVKTIKVPVFECAHCHYRWQRRERDGEGLPKVCPQCKRTTWNDSKTKKAQVASN